MLFQVLSVVSPAGSLIRSGRKSIEVRRWRPEVLPLRNLLIVQNRIRLTDETLEDHAGGIVALVDVLAVREWREDDLEKSNSSNFEAGWLAWELGNIRPAVYNRFVPAKRRIYEIDIDPKYLMCPDGSLAFPQFAEDSPSATPEK